MMLFKKVFLWGSDFIKNNRVAKYMYVSAGLAGLGIVLTYFFIVSLGWSEFWSAVIASFSCGTLHFFLLKRYIFYSQTRSKRKAMLQYAVYATNGGFAVFMDGLLFVTFLHLFALFIPWQHISIPLAKGLSMLILFVWNYNFHKHVTYRIH